MLLDSANLCNPTVLDRLNPLLEPHGGCRLPGHNVCFRQLAVLCR